MIKTLVFNVQTFFIIDIFVHFPFFCLLGVGARAGRSKVVGHHREGLAQAVPVSWDVCCSRRTWVNSDEGFIKRKSDVRLLFRLLHNPGNWRKKFFFPFVFLVCFVFFYISLYSLHSAHIDTSTDPLKPKGYFFFFFTVLYSCAWFL